MSYTIADMERELAEHEARSRAYHKAYPRRPAKLDARPVIWLLLAALPIFIVLRVLM